MNPQYPPQPNSPQGYPQPLPNQQDGYGVPPSHITASTTTIADQNPYGFILNPDASAHRPASGSNSILKRVLAVVGLLVVLTIVGVVVATLLIPKDTTGPQMLAVAQEQQELARVAGIVAQGSTKDEIKNFAATVQMSVDTNRQASVQYLTDRKVKADMAIIALKQDTATDTALETARSTNTFDPVAVQTLQNQLHTYQTNLKKAQMSVPGQKAQAILKASSDTATALIAQSDALAK